MQHVDGCVQSDWVNCALQFRCVSVPQYGGCLVLVFLLDIVLTTSIYAYRERLTLGFDQGLNHSLHAYGRDVVITADFNVMQAKVSWAH